MVEIKGSEESAGNASKSAGNASKSKMTTRQRNRNDPGTSTVNSDSESDKSDSGRKSPVVPRGPQKGKNGPGVLKHQCFRCLKKKWVVDFKEGKAADLTRVSVCLFCELQLTIDKQAAKISQYERALGEMRTAMERQAEKQKEQVLALRRELELERAVAAPEVRSPSLLPAHLESRLDTQESKLDLISTRIAFLEKSQAATRRESERGVRTDASGKKPSAARSYAAVAAASPKDVNNNVIVETVVSEGKPKRKKKTRLERRRDREARKKGAPAEDTSARKPVNLLIGDSLVGRQTGSRFKQLRQGNRVLSFPGARIDRIIHEISLLDVDRNSTLIVSVGGNDLYINSRRSGPTERIAADFERLLKAIKRKVNRAMVVGLLPRRYATREHYSKACWLNGRLLNLCKSYSLRYLDLWSSFFGKNDLYWRDGTHFSGKGCTLFAEQLDSKLFKQLKDHAVHPERDSRVPEVKKKKKRRTRTRRKKVAKVSKPKPPEQPAAVPMPSAASSGDGLKTPASKDSEPSNAKRGRSQTVSPVDVAVKRHRKNPSGSDMEQGNPDPDPDADPSDAFGTGRDDSPDEDNAPGNGPGTGGLLETSG